MPYSRSSPSRDYADAVSRGAAFHARNKRFHGRRVFSAVGLLRDLFRKHGVTAVLDYGCGKGEQHAEGALSRILGGVTFHSYDPCVPRYAKLPEDRFDAVVVNDVLGYVPEPDVDWVLAEIFGYARRCVFISASTLAPRKRDLVVGDFERPVAWWLERLDKVALTSSVDWLLRLCVGKGEYHLYQRGPDGRAAFVGALDDNAAQIDGSLLCKLATRPPGTKAGDAHWFLSSAKEDLAQIEEVLAPGDAILDVGCGYGRLAAAVASRPYRYVGLDVNPKRLAYARWLLEGHPSCEFRHLDIDNPRYHPGGAAATALRLPEADSTFAAAFAISLFTHMPDPAHVAHYLREIHRVVRPGGLLVSSWLPDPPWALSASSAHRAVFARAHIHAMLAAVGFTDVSTITEATEGNHLRLKGVRNGLQSVHRLGLALP